MIIHDIRYDDFVARLKSFQKAGLNRHDDAVRDYESLFMIAAASIFRPRLCTLAWVGVFVVSGLGGTSFAADAVWTVQKLIDNKPWDRFIGSPLAIRVEGRLGTSGGGQFRLVRCETVFTIDGEKLRAIPSKSTVEVKGQFKKNGGRLEFAVDEIKVVPNYVDQFELKASKLRLPTPDDWNELGDWAAERARFYEDADLMKKAKDAYTNAIELNYRSLKPTDAEGRFSLAKKMESLQLSDRRRMELIHEGFRIQWKTAQKADPPDTAAWQQLANTLAEQLPGANVPLKLVPPDLKETYDQDPDSTYRKANDDLRLQLHRLFFVAVTKKILLHGESRDGRDGDSIADQIDKLIPEEHALAEKQRVAKLGYRTQTIGVATRTEAENLAAAFRERHQNENAKEVLQQWIKAHEPRLKGDVVGLLQLADEYSTLLNDERTAVEYLSDAYRIDPTFEAVKTKLTSLGYQLKNSRWTKKSSVLPPPSDTASQSPTGISVGLTATGLRTLLGQPRSLARAITARGITEVWSFGPAGSTPLVIRLEQKGRDLEPKVTEFSGQ